VIKRKKSGPKPMAPDVKRTRLLGVKVNAVEYAKLENAAGPYPVATWARAVLISATEDPSPVNYRATKKATRKGKR